MEFLKEFLSHEDPNIRAKACSALGNMCRHSPYFYGALVSSCEKQINITFVVFLRIYILFHRVILCFKCIQPIMWNLQARYEIIKLLIDRCSDPDKRTRKFACFAVSFDLFKYNCVIAFTWLKSSFELALSLFINCQCVWKTPFWR